MKYYVCISCNEKLFNEKKLKAISERLGIRPNVWDCPYCKKKVAYALPPKDTEK